MANAPEARFAETPLTDAYAAIRATTEDLCDPLHTEDYVAQSAPFVSPTKWHLAHVTWFFETFVLEPHFSGYEPYHPAFRYLFNSYYNAVGPQYPQPERGHITRPTVAEVFDYRRHVDQAMHEAIPALNAEAAGVVDLGLHHEQQHQELMLMDIKHVFGQNPLHPVYKATAPPRAMQAPAMGWLPIEAGLHEIGHAGGGFCFDQETPRHQVYLYDAELADRPVTNGEFLEFMADGGYQRPELWLSDGWQWVKEHAAVAPLYWRDDDGAWFEYTLGGLTRVDPARPVCHVSYYEADAFAAWAGARLPSEAEWEVVAERHASAGHLLESGDPHPGPVGRGNQLLGDCWEWTCSAYAPYPGYRPPSGALGEYNGKFMCNQYVLRGGCCATPASHIRTSYRNFFYPGMRWPFTGIRLARG